MTPDDLVRALEETWGAISALLAEVRDDEWARPTPCAEWAVHDLGAHLGAIESQFQGLRQPEMEAPPPATGIDGWTAAGVRARRTWTPGQILAEIEAASGAQLAHLRALDGEAWLTTRMGPLGETTEDGLAAIRVFDLYLHLLDLRTALDRPLDLEAEPIACRVCVERVIELTPWGAVKKAGVANGARVRIDLSDPAGRTVDLVVHAARGRLDPADGDAHSWITGPAPAYLLLAAGRPAMAEAAGGIVFVGDDARRLLEGFRIFS